MARLMLTFSLIYLCYAREIPENVNSSITTSNQKPMQTLPLNETVCKQGMVKYPIENNNYICDCRTGYLYYEPEDDCYLPFKRGPCSSSEHLVYNQTKQMVSCVSNPCNKDGMVEYKGTCYELNTIGKPCKEQEILTLNEETFAVQCEDLLIDLRVIVQTPLRDCPVGSRRNARGICRVVLLDE